MAPIHSSQPNAHKANNAIGALFLSLFGAVWLAAWCLNTPGMAGGLFVVGGGAVALAALAVRLYRANAAAYVIYRRTAEGRRSSTVLGVVNGLQWVFIVLLAVLLPKTSSHWFVPGVVFIVGVHFIPLALALHFWPYLWVAAALVLLAAVTAYLSPAVSAITLCAFGTGVILWITAVYQIVARPLPAQSRTVTSRFTP